VSGALREALAGVRSRRGRVALSALGIALAAAMLAVAVTVGYELRTGFSRSAQAAHLPDVIARFDAQPADAIARRIGALPDVAAYSLREEVTNVGLSAGSHSAENGVVEVIDGGPRGYAVVAGHDISSAPGSVMLEQGVARAWGLAPGETIGVAGLGRERIAGLAQAPDNVAYPLATPRLYVSLAALRAHGGLREPRVDLAEIWLRDPAQLNTVLVQARLSSYGLRDLSIVTREGVRVLIDEAAGIVIALLVALSLVALATATVMLAASARAEVQRRLRAIGIQRDRRLAGIRRAGLRAGGPDRRGACSSARRCGGGAVVGRSQRAAAGAAQRGDCGNGGCAAPGGMLRGCGGDPDARRRLASVAGNWAADGGAAARRGAAPRR
jgi:hypothetical protein